MMVLYSKYVKNIKLVLNKNETVVRAFTQMLNKRKIPYCDRLLHNLCFNYCSIFFLVWFFFIHDLSESLKCICVKIAINYVNADNNVFSTDVVCRRKRKITIPMYDLTLNVNVFFPLISCTRRVLHAHFKTTPCSPSGVCILMRRSLRGTRHVRHTHGTNYDFQTPVCRHCTPNRIRTRPPTNPSVERTRRGLDKTIKRSAVIRFEKTRLDAC